MRTPTLLAALSLLVGCAGANVNSANGDAAYGANLYADNCAGCHGADATGGSGPNIAGISGGEAVDVILYGEDSMPGFADSLSDQDISDILAWLGEQAGGNGGGEGGEGEDDAA